GSGKRGVAHRAAAGAGAGAGYAYNHSGLGNGRWSGNYTGWGGAGWGLGYGGLGYGSGVGGWWMGSPGYGWGYSDYSNPYYGDGTGSGGVPQAAAVQPVAAQPSAPRSGHPLP